MVFSRELRHLIGMVGNVFMGFNFPQQIMQDYMAGQYWNKLNTTGYAEWFKITTVELLKRRNKPSEPCSIEWKEHDDWILKQHVKDVGCRAPYMNLHTNFETCDTQTKMRESIMDWEYVSDRYPAPCETASNIGYTFSTVGTQDSSVDPSSLMIMLTYTKKIKIISQSRLIDEQALIGYIGGYVGLILGTMKIL